MILTKQPRPPAGLAPGGRELWKRILKHLVEQGEEPKLPEWLLLDAACRAFDRLEEARALVAAEGLLVTDRFRQRQPHPAITIERDALNVLNDLLAMLGLVMS